MCIIIHSRNIIYICNDKVAVVMDIIGLLFIMLEAKLLTSFVSVESVQ